MDLLPRSKSLFFVSYFYLFFASFLPRNATMLRLLPTTIVLGRSDLREFERRRLRRREEEVLNRECSRFAVAAADGATSAALQIQHAQRMVSGEELEKLQTGQGQIVNVEGHPLTLQTSVPHRSVQIASKTEHRGSRALGSPESLSITEDGCPTITELQDEHSYVCVGSENPARDSQRSPSPSTDDFHYGGFLESSIEQSNTPDKPSPFGMLFISENATSLTYGAAPDDISTPQNIQLPDASRLRQRIPLPRSPLFLSHNVSSSPEHRPTSGLTPRVASRMATHNTPGIIFAQPPRRMRRRSPRTFRHQTNSFSFDSSERASAAYEQERVSSNSTNDSTPRPSDDLSLHEELCGSSFQNLRVTSGTPYALPDPLVEGFSTVRIRDESDEVVSTKREFIFSSPQLPLPPPFSTVPRNVSGAESLPGVEYMPQNPLPSPIGSSSTTSGRNGVEGGRPSPNSSAKALEHVGEVDSSPLVRCSPNSSAVKC